MRVIGTAGHVDHGKSTLIQALTGIHPDRLKEEQEREMTIDLGFAWLTLPNGEEIGIVDVPGHRDFIENMLAGIGGIDAAMFVVAADEGVMPQTREHLAIINILQINGGVVALTKIDLVDEEWLDLVEEDLRQVLKDTVLENAPIVRVSSRTKKGLKTLLDVLGEVLSEHPSRPDLLRPRLPIDRVFTIAGFGTVVTGTLSDGTLHVGEEISILPNYIKGRIRGLQTHKQKETFAVPGSRTAINISGVSVDQIQRGDVVIHPGTYTPSRRLDVSFRLLSDASTSIKHNMETKMFIGTSEVVARIRLLGTQELMPGEEGWLQLETNKPVVATRGDRYILRRPSPGETLGGGRIIDPHPERRYKRFSQKTITRLQAIARGTPSDIIIETAELLGAAPLKEIIDRSNLEQSDAQSATKELLHSGLILPLNKVNENKWSDLIAEDIPLPPNMIIITQRQWNLISEELIQTVNAYHQTYPLRQGMPREELKSRMYHSLKSSNQLFNLVMNKLVKENKLAESGPWVYLPNHTIQFSPQQEQRINKLLNRFTSSPYATPSIKDCKATIGEEEFNALVALNSFVVVSNDVVFRRDDYETMLQEIRALLNKQGTISAAEVRDHFHTSRKYALALLEYLDSVGITQRVGDVRKLR